MMNTTQQTLPQLVRDAAKRFGADEALLDGDLSLSFAELEARIKTTVRALMASGVERGDRVAIWAPNIAEFVISALAIHSSGAVMVPINTRFKGAEAAYVIERSQARMLFTVSDFLDIDYVHMLKDQPGIDSIKETIVLRGGAPSGTTTFDDFLARAPSVSEHDATARIDAVQPNDLCHILFTSGTTGSPKGVMLEHGPVCTTYSVLADVFDMRRGDRQLVVLPFFHSFGLHVGIVCSLIKGVTIIPHLVFDPVEVMKRIEAEKITLFPGPPAIFQAFADNPARTQFDLSSLRSATIGGSGFPPALVEFLHEEMNIPRVQSGYGLTESSGLVTLSSPPQSAEVIAYTAGCPIPGLEVRIIDADNNTLVQGDPGEVLVRGYNIMRGYLDDPVETAKTIDPDGWLHTGDIGYFREDGNLVISDRKKDMFTSGGFNVYPAEVEKMIMTHPSILQAAVVGVADHRMGEVGMVFIVPAAGASLNAEELIAWARENMANYKVPRHVRIVKELPMNATGKVLKPQLRSLAAESLES